MKNAAHLPRTHLIKRALPCVHVHLGAPPGFGKTVLLKQLYHHFMRGGRGPRRGCFLDPDRFNPEVLLAPASDGHWIVAVDDLGPNDFSSLNNLLSEIHTRGLRMRLFTAGPPLPFRPFAFYKSAGMTLELGMDDLAFTAEEVRTLCPTRPERLRELTAGWPFPTSYLASLEPSLQAPALNDDDAFLRTWMRDRVLAPCEKEDFEFLTRLATMQRLDHEAVARFGSPDAILARLKELRHRGWPLYQEEKDLRMHPFMRCCLLGELKKFENGDEYRQEAIRYYSSRGDLLQAARATFEAGYADELARVLVRLENRIHRIFDPELMRELGKWIDYVIERKASLPSRCLALAARYKSMVGLFTEALHLAQKAIEGARDGEAFDVIIRSRVLIARILRCRMSVDDSDRVLADLQAEFPAPAWPLRYEIVAERAYNRILKSDYHAALGMMEDLRQEAAAEDDPVALWAERFMAIPLFFLGHCTRALACFRTGEKMPLRHRLMLDRHGVHLIAARCLMLQGFQDQAQELLKKQLALKKLSDDPDDLWLVLMLSADNELIGRAPETEYGIGDLSRLKARLERAQVLLADKLENPFFHAWYRGYFLFLEALNRPDSIRENLQRALDEARFCSPFLYAMILARGGLYRLLFLKEPNELPEILEMLHECLAVSLRIGSETFHSIANALLAVIYDRIGAKETALQHLKTAFVHFERENLTGLLPFSCSALPLTQMAWENGLAPAFLKRLIERWGYRPQKWRVRLFGRFEITVLNGEAGEERSPVRINRSKVRELLAYLIHHGGKTVERRALIADLWPLQPWSRATRLFSVTLSQLRVVMREIGMESCFWSHRDAYRLNTSEIETDRLDLENLREYLQILPRIERKDRNLPEEFERLRLAPLREGYLGEFDAPWARAAAREIDAQVARATSETPPILPRSA